MFTFSKANKSTSVASNPISSTAAVETHGNHDRIVAIIGTAGRDKSKPMDDDLWRAMCSDLKRRIQPGDHLVSGGAAWADHLAVHAFLEGWASNLTLFLPAPMKDGRFVGPHSSAASAANFYHDKFARAIGLKTLSQIEQAHAKGAQLFYEPEAAGYAAMFARNKKVAKMANVMISYTFGEGEEPADGGTLNTWKQATSKHLVHVPLGSLKQAEAQNIAQKSDSLEPAQMDISRPADQTPPADLFNPEKSAPSPAKRFSFKQR